ncbi:MAG: dihydrolipoyl dehydrogenase [Magnetococcales bacterium]|nr:dihydrolipoyl dehydrogenase [Magnetococcales bacterium]
MSEPLDLIVIGAGPGGYVAAIRAAQLGLKTVCVEKEPSLGGTCLNVGCIPSKALLHSTHLLEMAQTEMASHGIRCSGVGVDIDAMMQRKNRIITHLTGGIDFLFKKNKITRIRGTATLTAPDTVTVADDAGITQTLKGKNILIATGSVPASIPGFSFDGHHVIDSTNALSLSGVPERLAIIGGGVIGLELGTVWRRLGSSVTIIEATDNILPGMDGELRRMASRIFKKQGLHLRPSTLATEMAVTDHAVTLTLKSGEGPTDTLTIDKVLVAVGRVPSTGSLGLDHLGIAMDPRGFIRVDNHYRTNIPGILAIGDVIGGPMLAHKAEEEGIVAVERLTGQGGQVHRERIPGVVYTNPEIATVGPTEESLKHTGVDYRVGRFPFSANSRARSMDQTDGFVKILADPVSDRILAAHIIGPQAGDLIAEAVLAMESDLAAEDLARTCHSHPSLSETVREAALAVDGRALHM